MPVVGAVFQMSPDPTLRAAALQHLERDARVTLGVPRGPNLPAVIETDSQEADDRFWEEIRQLSGLDRVVVAFADISDVSALDDPQEL